MRLRLTFKKFHNSRKCLRKIAENYEIFCTVDFRIFFESFLLRTNRNYDLRCCNIQEWDRKQFILRNISKKISNLFNVVKVRLEVLSRFINTTFLQRSIKHKISSLRFTASRLKCIQLHFRWKVSSGVQRTTDYVYN